MTDSTLDRIMDGFRQGLTLDGAQRVLEVGRELVSNDLIARAKPEEYTKVHLIQPILESLECRLDSVERIFDGPRGIKRELDYTFTSAIGTRYILEAKPYNADLFRDSAEGGVNQIIDAMKLHDVTKEYSYGIATNGCRWIFVNTERSVVADLNIFQHYDMLGMIFRGVIHPELDREGISRKFYDWYSALLYGGRYKDHEDKIRHIPVEESLVEAIGNVSDLADRERIAQTTMDRLIFIRFLESKKIIPRSVIQYLMELPDDRINGELRSLFFTVMNTEPSKRKGVAEAFEGIPYLNGGLFTKNPSEIKYSAFYDYWISPRTLREVLRFLDSFTFTHRTNDNMEALDPEILGYIFEMSMVSRERKGTGAFYTPREITTFMSREAIHPAFVSKVKDHLRKYGYPEADLSLIKTIDDVYRLSDIRLAELFGEVLPHIKVCDNACGSGAFLLAASDVLFEIYYTLNAKSGLSNSDVAIKKLILGHNIYGVDINPNAVEIAKLRMWLWVVDSYRPGFVEALPNIDYNVLTGDSLIGYASLEGDLSDTISIDDYGVGESTVGELLKEREGLISRYRYQSGESAAKSKLRIEEIGRRIYGKLSMAIYNRHAKDILCDRLDFFALKPFHWGLEFAEVFAGGGFDVIVGNPPYIHLEDMKGSLAREFYEHSGYRTFKAKGDVYQLFFERSRELLREGGTLSYITSNSWMKAKSGAETRSFFIHMTDPQFIIDLADLRIFKSATVEAGIFSFNALKERSERNSVIIPSCILSEDAALSDIKAFLERNMVKSEYRADDIWAITDEAVDALMNVIKRSGTPLKNTGVHIRYGIKYGSKEAFVLNKEQRDALVSKDPRNSEMIMPIVSGRDIKKFTFERNEQYVILAGYGSHNEIANQYPDIYRHLLKYEDKLKSRGQCKGKMKDGCDYPGQHHWLELDNNPTEEYISTFNMTKIAWIDLSDEGKFAIVPPGFALADTAFFFTCDNPTYLLGILNSKLITWYFSNICATSGAGTNRWKKQYVEQIPIPINPPNKGIIEDIVTKLLKNSDDAEDLRFLDVEVCKAYNLSDEDIAYIQGW